MKQSFCNIKIKGKGNVDLYSTYLQMLLTRLNIARVVKGSHILPAHPTFIS